MFFWVYLRARSLAWTECGASDPETPVRKKSRKSGRARFIMNYYNELALGYKELHYAEQLNKLKIIKENLKLKKKAKILDVGCGQCWSAEIFDNITGVDISEGLLKLNKNKKMKAIVASAESLPFEDKSFDAVICVTAIHHFEVEKALKEMKRVVRENGEVVISVLKKAESFNEIVDKIKKNFKVEKEVDEEKDLIVFCR